MSRIQFTAEYTNSPSYNASGKAEKYEVDVPAETLTHINQLFYYLGQTWATMTWLGWPILKYPNDLMIYQQILFETQPDLIIECGTAAGGSALYLATVCDAIGKGEIETIDIEKPKQRPLHDRIFYTNASSTHEGVVASMGVRAKDKRVMVILDSSHTKDHVLAELKAYGPLVSPGCYLIVEDTNINGHPVRPDFGPGPMEAMNEWLPDHPEFERDRSRERLILTANPGGYLRRK